MVLGNSGTDLVSRLSNKIYELCRTKTIQVPGFPDFTPLVNSLREGSQPQSTATYKVCVQQHATLKILESMAGKWLAEEALKDRALDLINEHNKHFNPDGDMMVTDRTASTTCLCVKSFGVTS